MGYIVRTLVDGVEVDTQAVNDQTELKDNSFVTFNKEQALEVNGGDVFSGGTNGKVDGIAHEKARNAFETVSCNILAVPTTDKEIQDAYIAYVERLRDEFGVKFQIVLPAIDRETPINHVGVIEYVNEVEDPVKDAKADFCYWLAGAEAGCKVQNSCTAEPYDGSFSVKADFTYDDQRRALKKGQILFHKDGDEIVMLRDVNTFTTIEKGQENKMHNDFGRNQVVRVIDGILAESGRIWTKHFLGKRNNTSLERAELRNQLLRVRERYNQIGAIYNYDPTLLTINPGAKPNEVVGTDGISASEAMDTFYFEIEYLSNVVG